MTGTRMREFARVSSIRSLTPSRAPAREPAHEQALRRASGGYVTHNSRGDPPNDQSAGKRRSGKTRKGSKWLRASLTEAAIAATRKKDSYLAAQYRRLGGRRGHAKALTAVGHSILTAIWHMLKTGELYRDLGNDYFVRQDPDRVTRRLIRRLEALGHSVLLQAQEVST